MLGGGADRLLSFLSGLGNSFSFHIQHLICGLIIRLLIQVPLYGASKSRCIQCSLLSFWTTSLQCVQVVVPCLNFSNCCFSFFNLLTHVSFEALLSLSSHVSVRSITKWEFFALTDLKRMSSSQYLQYTKNECFPRFICLSKISFLKKYSGHCWQVHTSAGCAGSK